jgi:uncharacterized small protein (DUF1192 family)
MNDEPRQSTLKPVDLEAFSEDELIQRISDLKDEMTACERELEKKRAHRSAADAFFDSH